MDKAPVLYCKCKMCGSTYLDSIPNGYTIEPKHIGRYASTISTTHDCSKGDNPLKNTYGVGEVFGIILQ